MKYILFRSEKISNPIINIVNVFIIILNISMFNTVLPSIIFGNWEAYFHQLFILLINIFYLICNGKLYLFTVNRNNILIYLIFLILISIYLLEIPRYYIGGLEGSHLLPTIQSGLVMFSFGMVLNTIYYKRQIIEGQKKVIFSIVRIYVYFCLIIVGISDCVFFLWQLNLIDIFQNPIPANFSTFIDNNTENYNASYFSPFNITIVSAEQRIANLATFCGISYEPHIASYLVTPAMFLLHGLNRISKMRKAIFTVFFVIFFIIASSATNIIALLILALILILRLLLVDKKIIFTLLLIISIAGLIILINFENMESIYVLTKIAEGLGGASADYSRRFLVYVISPTTLWGDGVFNVPYPYAKVDNIGLIFSLLVVSFYLLGFLASLKAIFQRDKLLCLVGCAALYFFLHSLKIIQLIFIFPFIIFVFFILLKAYEETICFVSLSKKVRAVHSEKY